MSEWSDGYRAALADVERLTTEREQDNRIRKRRLAAVREALPLFDPVLARREREAPP